MTTSECIVVNYIKYSETSIIVRAFAKDHGYQSFIVGGVRNVRSRMGIALFQPFSYLELVFRYNPNRDLHRVTEAKTITPLPEVQLNPIKNTITLFLCEILDKILRSEPTPNQNLFHFLKTSVHILNEMESGYESFHLFVLLKLTHFLGFGSNDVHEIAGSNSLSESGFGHMEALQHMELYLPIAASGDIRLNCLEVLVDYYQHHIETLGPIKSIQVLHQVFH